VSLTQKGYLQKVLQRFSIDGDTKFVSTPLASHFKLKTIMSPTTVEKCEYITRVSYTNTVSSLMYAIVYTRPDLSQAVSIISGYMHDPEKGHWEVVKWVLRYIKGTIYVGLIFEKDSIYKQECIGYVESDYEGDLDKRRSTTEYVFTLSQTPVS